MAVALFIACGSNAGQQIPVSAGQPVLVGRTSRSDYAFPGDTYLSGVHFEIACNEGECAVRDLGSSNGTFVNGARIEQAAVKDGDQISAGEMTFLVQFSSGEQALASPVPVAAAGTPVERTARMFAPGFEPEAPAQTTLTGEQKRVRDILMYQTAPLFAVLDAARDPILPQLLGAPALATPLRDRAGWWTRRTRALPGGIGTGKFPERAHRCSCFSRNSPAFRLGQKLGHILYQPRVPR